MSLITWLDELDGDPVHLRVIYAEEAGGGYREATPADLAAAGYIKRPNTVKGLVAPMNHWVVHTWSAIFIAYLLCELVSR